MPSSKKLMITMVCAFTLFVSALVLPTDSFGQTEFSVLSAEEFAAFVATLPASQKQRMSTEFRSRKQLIEQFRRVFSLAQAALAEGLDKDDGYAHSFTVEVAKVLAQVHGKHNEFFQVSKADIDAYLSLHQPEFEAAIAFFTRNNKEQPTGDQLAALKASWGELQIRAEQSRVLGLDTQYAVQIQLKIMRAHLLANLYHQFIENRYAVTADQKNSYLAEHPEDSPEHSRTRLEQLLARVKSGESFEALADEINMDGTKGQGGDLGWFSQGTTDPAFEKAAFALGIGEISGLVESSFGVHLIRVEGKRKTLKGNQLVDEVKARHIYLTTNKLDEALGGSVQAKIKQDLDAAVRKYPVKVPEDFTVTVDEKP
jgi:hypothetical protein